MNAEPILTLSGTCDITPEAPTALFGYGHRTGLWDAVESRLECNALLLAQGERRVLLLEIDTLFPSPLLQQTLESRLPVPCELLIVASHTHFAPGLDPSKPRLGKFDQKYFDLVVERISQLLTELFQQAPGPACVLQVTRPCEAGVYRRKRWLTVEKKPPFVKFSAALLPNLSTKIDQDVTTIGLFDEGGKLRTVVWSWACHPTASPRPYSISADFVGTIRQRIRDFAGYPVPVVFLPGAMGDVRPRILSQNPSLGQRLRYPGAPGYFAVPTTADDYAAFCRSLEQAIPLDLLTTTNAIPLSGKLSLHRTDCPLDHLLTGDDARTVSIPIARLELNDDLKLAFIGAEPSNRYVARLREICGPATITVGYFQNVFGYLPVEEQLPEGGYEVDGFQYWFGLSGEFKPGFEQRVLDCFHS